jgi:Tol biopolymer transport system component
VALRTVYSQGERTVLDGGIYTLTVNPDDLANHTEVAMSGDPVVQIAPIEDVVPDNDFIWANYDWRPDGGALVYMALVSTPPGQGIWRADAPYGVSDPVCIREDGGGAWGLRWSPDASRILFMFGDIRSMTPEGDDEILLVEDPPDRGQSQTFLRYPGWSPGSTHIVYSQYVSGKNSSQVDVVIAANDGTGQTDITTGFRPSWRGD